MPPKRRLGEVLVDAGLIDDFQLRAALSDQKRWGRPLGMTLVKLGFIREEEMVRVLSRQLDVPIVDLHGKRIAPEALAVLPVQVAEKSRCIPLFTKREGGRDVLYLGMEDPTDLGVLDDLAFRTGKEIRSVLVGPTQLSEAIERYYHKLEWDADDDPAAELGQPVEPGDTAPLVFHPEAQTPPQAEEDPVGPDTLRRADTPAPVADRPQGERELDLGPGEPATPSPLGPEFLTEPAQGAPRQRPAEPGPAPRDTATPQPAAAPRAAGSASPTRPRDVPTRTILRALTHLLVEKGVIDRAELLAAITRFQAEDRGGDA